MNYSNLKKRSLHVLFIILYSTIGLLSFAQGISATTPSLDMTNTDMPKRGQAIYLEVVGAGIIYSLNYDTRFSEMRGGIGMRVGASAFELYGDGIYSLPLQLNYLLGKEEDNHFLELGIGGTYYVGDFFLSEDSDPNVLGTMTFGYRYQPVEGFIFRASFTPLFSLASGDYDGFFLPYYGGVSLGYAF